MHGENGLPNEVRMWMNTALQKKKKKKHIFNVLENFITHFKLFFSFGYIFLSLVYPQK